MNSHIPRRIAMLSVHTCPLAMLGGKKTGGMNVYVRDFSRALGRIGIPLDVFTRSQDDCQPRIKHDLGYGARVIHIPAGPEKPIPLAEIGEHIEAFTAGVLAFTNEEGLRYDLIHSHYWLSGLVADELREAWGGQIPIVHMFHTLGHMKNRIADRADQRVSPDRIAGEERIIDLADRIIAATPAERAQLQWLYGAESDKIVIIPPGVDLERFQPIPKEDARQAIGILTGHKNILFAGRIEALKGIDTLLEAIALIQLRFPHVMQDVCVAIIGGDPWSHDADAEMARLQEMRQALGLHDMVTFLGAKDQAALPAYYAAAEMVVMPSHYESFGMVALEAMAMGTPVIASEVGGLAFLIEDGETGFHVPSRDPGALAEKIYVLLTDEGCRQQMGRNARAHAQQYSWDRVVQQMSGVYSDLLTQSSSAA